MINTIFNLSPPKDSRNLATRIFCMSEKEKNICSRFTYVKVLIIMQLKYLSKSVDLDSPTAKVVFVTPASLHAYKSK